MDSRQLDLFGAVAGIYADQGRPVTNADLYEHVATRVGMSEAELNRREPVGRNGKPRHVVKRAIRWQQQTLKCMGVLERVPGERGVWQLTRDAGRGLSSPTHGVALLAFRTDLGMAIWGDAMSVFEGLQEHVHLVVTSPPYPLRKPRAYGNPVQSEYVDFIVEALAPVVTRLAPGGSLCLNLGNDVFEPGLPSRPMYCERVLIAFQDRLGLSLMDRLVWHNPSKPPGPVQWASIHRYQLNVAWEPVYWLTNDPARVRADNRRVLEAHTARHRQFVASGGARRTLVNGDGAHRTRQGAYARPTPGRIPRNVMVHPHRCRDTDRYRADARRLGLPVHGATMPLSLPDFLVRLLTEPGDLVVDPFGGTVKTGMAAERLGRRWLVVERILQYLRGAGERFRDRPGFVMPAGLETWPAMRNFARTQGVSQ